MVIFQPQHISQLRTIDDVQTLGRWMALLSQNLEQAATALALEMPRPGVGIMTVTTNEADAGYLFYFQLSKGVKIPAQKTLQSTFVLVAPARVQAQLLPKLRANLTDQKLVHKLHSLRSKQALYDLIAAKFQFALTARPMPLVLPNEQLDPTIPVELNLPLVVQTAPGTGPEPLVTRPEQGSEPNDPELTPASTKAAPRVEHNVFADADFHLPGRDPLGHDTASTKDEWFQDETEYLLRYYETGSDQTRRPTFPVTKYFLSTVPEPFLVLREFPDYFHSACIQPGPGSERPVPLVEREGVPPDQDDLALPATVIEADQVATQPVVSAMEADLAPVADLSTVEETLEPTLAVAETTAEFPPTCSLEPTPEVVVAPTTGADFAETTFEQLTPPLTPPVTALVPVPTLLVNIDWPGFATTGVEPISFLEQDLEHLFDPNAFSDEDLAWLRAERPDPSLGMFLDDELAGAGLTDLGSGLHYLERDWTDQGVNRLEKLLATTGAETEIADDSEAETTFEAADDSELETTSEAVDVSEPETTFESAGTSELETTSESVDVSEAETTSEAETEIVNTSEPATTSAPEDSDQAMGMDQGDLSTVSTATTDAPAPVVDQQGDNASLVPDPEPGLAPLTTLVEEANNAATPAIVATAEQSEQVQDQWVYWAPQTTPDQSAAQAILPSPSTKRSKLKLPRAVPNIFVILTPGANPTQTMALTHWLARLNDQVHYAITIEIQPGQKRFSRAQARTADLVLYTSQAKGLRRFRRALCYEVDPTRFSAHPLAWIRAGLTAVAQTPPRRWWQWGQADQNQGVVPHLLPPPRLSRP